MAIAAYLFALGPVATAASDTIAAASVSAVLGPWAGKIVALTILVSTFSAANSVILTAPRVFYAMAQDNLFFKELAVVHVNFRTPVFAIVALGVWSAVLVCAGQLGQFQKLIEGVIFIGWIFYGLGAAAIFPIENPANEDHALNQFLKLIEGVIFIGWIFYGLGAAAIFPIRRANGDRLIPYRVPGYPWTPILFVLAAAAIVGNAVYAAFRDPGQFQNLTAAIVLFAIGLPAYLFWRKRAAA